jgi:hypothetical protein
MSINKSEESAKKNEALENLDKKSYGLDLPTGDGWKDLNPFNKALDQKPHNTEKDKYTDAKVVENGTGKPSVETSREKNAPNADKPTTAAADPGLDISSIIKQVDPLGTAQAFAKMVIQLNMIRSIMKVSGGGNKPNAPANKELMKSSIVGALGLLVQKYGYDQVIKAFTLAFADGNIKYIDPRYKEILTECILTLVQQSLQHGVKNIPVSSLPTLVYGNLVPKVLVVTVPDLYVQQYFTQKEDPYPGYIQWKGQDGTTIYTKRSKTELPFKSMTEELTMISERSIATALGPYIKHLNLTVFIINSVFAAQDHYTQTAGLDKSIGKNALSNLSKILGLAGLAINLVQSAHLPNSVLNTGAVSKTLGDFSKNMAFLKVMKNNSSMAFMPPLPFGNLAAIPGLSNLAGLAGINLGALGGLANIGAIAALGGLNVNQLGKIMVAANIASASADLTGKLIKSMDLK